MKSFSKRPDVYVSIDIEADGPIPGDYSMLSLGAASFTVGEGLVGKFHQNIHPRLNAKQHPSTMQFWEGQPEAWKAMQDDVVKPTKAMERFHHYLLCMRNHGRLICIGYPVTFDFMFVHWYMIHYVGENPLSFSALDIKTFASFMLNLSYRDAVKRRFPKHWFDKDQSHSHIAVEDALEQGEMFIRMLRDHKQNVHNQYILGVDLAKPGGDFTIIKGERK